MRTFTSSSAPPWIFATVVLGGPLVALIAYRALRTDHDIEARFCEHCWRRYSQSAYIWPAVAVISTLCMVAAVVVDTKFRSDAIPMLLVGTSAALVVIGFAVYRLLRPHVVLATNEFIKVLVPERGVVTFHLPNAMGLVGLGLNSPDDKSPRGTGSN